MQLRVPEYAVELTDGNGNVSYQEACIGIGWSGNFSAYPTETDPDTGKERVADGTWPLSVRQCSTVDFEQSPATSAQFFQEIFKYKTIETASGYATDLNPPVRWRLIVDEETGDLLASTEKPDEADYQFAISRS